MNIIGACRESGVSVEVDRKMNILRGCIMVSHLETQDKKDLMEFINDLEEYLEGED